MKQRNARKSGLLLLALVTMLLSSLPIGPAAQPTAAAQSIESSGIDVTNVADANENIVYEEEIIYVGDDERIYVLDTHQDGNKPLVKWASPDDDWRSVDVGDFNNDGDMEIVAVGGDIDSGKLAIWDPVVRTGEPGLPTVNGIPWKLLHQRLIPGRPAIVKAGNFDPNLPGDEILYGFKMNDDIKPEDDDEFRTTIIKSSIPNPDGMNWTDHISAKDDGNEWSYVEAGDLGDGGPDEIALLDEDGGEINVFRLADGFQRILGESSSSSPYRAVAFGDFFSGAYDEVIISRNENFPKISTFYYQYFPGEDEELRYEENQVEIISPYPRFLFVANVNKNADGNEDDEVFMLRRDSEPRLISRNHGSDPMPTLEADLDDDDGYRAGAGGDLDGDGNDEVIIIRDDRLRVYKNEEVRWSVEEFVVSAETKVLRTGDLDGGGSPSGPSFVFSHESISQSLEPDTSVQNREYSLTVTGTDDVVSFTYDIPNAPSWVSISINPLRVSENDPAEVYASFNAAGLTVGTYTASLIFTASSPTTSNSPFTVPIILNVQEAQITPSPAALYFDYHPCTDSLDATSMKISVGGTQGVTYNAAIVDRPLLDDARASLDGAITSASIDTDGFVTLEDRAGDRATIKLPAPEIRASAVTSVTWPSGADWATAVSETSKVPDTITVSVDPNVRGADRQQAVLVLVGDERAGDSPTNVRLVPLNLICANGRAYLPSVLK